MKRKQIILAKIKECEKLWSKYSCDCLSFELNYWEKQLQEVKKHEKS